MNFSFSAKLIHLNVSYRESYKSTSASLMAVPETVDLSSKYMFRSLRFFNPVTAYLGVSVMSS